MATLQGPAVTEGECHQVKAALLALGHIVGNVDHGFGCFVSLG